MELKNSKKIEIKKHTVMGEIRDLRQKKTKTEKKNIKQSGYRSIRKTRQNDVMSVQINLLELFSVAK